MGNVTQEIMELETRLAAIDKKLKSPPEFDGSETQKWYKILRNMERMETGIYDIEKRMIREGDIIEAECEPYGDEKKRLGFIVIYDPSVAAFVAHYLDRMFYDKTEPKNFPHNKFPSQNAVPFHKIKNIRILGNAQDAPELCVSYSSVVDTKIQGVRCIIAVSAVNAEAIPKEPINLYEIMTSGECGHSAGCEYAFKAVHSPDEESAQCG